MAAETHVLDLKGRVRIIQMIEQKGWEQEQMEGFLVEGSEIA